VTKLILLLIVLGVVAAIAGLVRQWWLEREIREGRLEKMPEVRESAAAGCCGLHETCEKDSLLAAVSRDIEYYEDEELDRFRGRSSDQYSDSEIDEFNEVLTTLRSEEVAGWIRSLQLRGVALLVETIETARDRINPRLKIDGIVATMVDSRTLHSREVLQRLQEAFGDLVFDTRIGRTIKFPDASVATEPIISYAPNHAGAHAYRRLAREVIARGDAA